MKLVFPLAVMILMTASGGYSGLNQWTPTNGPNGGLFTYFVTLPDQNAIVFAGGGFLNAYRPLYRSSNVGSTWNRLLWHDQTLTGVLKVDPNNSSRIILGGLIETMGFYESLDIGQTWTTISNAIPFTPNDFELDPLNSNIVYGVESGGFGGAAKFYKSSDGGRTWSRTVTLAHPRLDGADIEVDPSSGQLIYVILGNGHVYKSTNGGNTFQDSSRGLPRLQRGVRALAIDKKNPAILYSAGFEGVFKSTDRANTWKDTACSCRVREIDLDPIDTKIVFAVGRGDLGYEQAVKSTNGGQTWNKLNLPRFENHPYTAVMVNVNAPRTIFASSEVRGIFKSTDGGSTWRPSNRNIRLQTIDLTMDSKRPGHMYVIARDGFRLKNVVYETINRGSIWSSIKSLDSYSIEQLKVHPQDSRILAAVTGIQIQGSTGVLVSTDSGTTWQIRGSAAKVFFDPTVTSTLYGVSSDRVNKSQDLGTTWRSITPSLMAGESISDASIHERTGQVIYISTSCSLDNDCVGRSRIMKSSNAGKTWKEVGGKTLPQTADFPNVEIDPKNAMIVYAVDGIQGGGLSKSIDGGNTWSRFGDFQGFDLTIDRFNSQRLLSLSFGGDNLFISNDGGNTWRPFDTEGLFPPRPYLQRTFISEVVFSHWDRKTIFAALDGVKVYTQQ